MHNISNYLSNPKEAIVKSLEMKGLGTKRLAWAHIGEGAWHTAYRIATNEHDSMVIRFPKPFAYGQPFRYDEAELTAEYAGRGYYYERANRVRPGICPEFYMYSVHPEHSFTIESYCGPAYSLEDSDGGLNIRLGRQCGELFAAMERNEPELPGFGFLEWSNGMLTAGMEEDFAAYWKRDTEGYLEQFDVLARSPFSFDAASVKDRLQAIAERRLQAECKLSLTNRDISPENMIVRHDSLRIIDPLPLIYNGHTFAGNLLNNYYTLFPSYFRSPRYRKHRFDKHAAKLRQFADGFLEGYAQADPLVRESVLAEQYLMLFDLTCDHLKLLEGEFTESLTLRVGDKDAVAERLPLYLRKLEEGY